jgi:FMN-dependent NADH-azoreductase
MLRFGRDAAIAKFAPLFGEPVTGRQQRIWQQVLDEIERVRASIP